MPSGVQGAQLFDSEYKAEAHYNTVTEEKQKREDAKMLTFEVFTGMAGMFMAGGALIPLLMGGAFPAVLFAVGAGLTAAACLYAHAYVNSAHVWKAVCLLLTAGIMVFAGLYWKDTLLSAGRTIAACCRIVARVFFASFCI